VCTTAANLCRIVATMVLPVVPSISEKILSMLRCDEAWGCLDRDFENMEIGPFDRIIDRIVPKKLEAIIEASKKEHEAAAPTAKEPEVPELEEEIQYDSFIKVDLRAAKVLSAEPVKKADKLLRIELDVGPFGQRTVLAGIRKSFEDPEALVGRTVIVVANLAPRKMRGEMSQGMILAAGEDETNMNLVDPGDVPPGTRIR